MKIDFLASEYSQTSGTIVVAEVNEATKKELSENFVLSSTNYPSQGLALRHSDEFNDCSLKEYKELRKRYLD